MNLKRALSGVLTSLALVFGLVLVAAPAQALNGCTLATTTAKSAQVICTSGTGYVRAAIGCTKWWSGDYVYTRYGAWVGRNQTSVAKCNWDENPRVTNGRIWHWYENG